MYLKMYPISPKGGHLYIRRDIYIHDCTLDADLYRQYMVETEDVDGVFDEIKIKMPWLRGHPVIVQQDGAPPHTGHDNVEFFNNEGQKDSWNITVVTQPAQSPDLNVNDLGFFRSLKCRVEQLKAEEATLENLYEAVLEAWNEYDSVTLKRIWGHQFACYRSILEDQGGNWYEAPHTGARTRQSCGLHVVDLQMKRALITQAQLLVNDYFGN